MGTGERTAIVILAGGESTRMGRDKLRLEFEGETLLARAARRFSERFAEVYVSVGGRAAEDVGLPVVRDVLPGLGPLSGLHAALTTLGRGAVFSVFLVAADMPRADPELAARIIEMSEGYDACAPGTPERPEPLFACYRRGVLPLVERAAASGDYSLAGILRAANTRYADVGGEFVNVNTPDDYARLTGGQGRLDKRRNVGYNGGKQV